jgi:hypothetical protein
VRHRRTIERLRMRFLRYVATAARVSVLKIPVRGVR